jgi:hypothetical protein
MSCGTRENLAREAGANINPNTYLPLLKAATRGVKAGDLNALALLGALQPDGNTTAAYRPDDLTAYQQPPRDQQRRGEELLRTRCGAL